MPAVVNVEVLPKKNRSRRSGWRCGGCGGKKNFEKSNELVRATEKSIRERFNREGL